jgi:D-alanyl-lipoteichoic acid acyltransferase DltB (MBOAT superfamily)
MLFNTVSFFLFLCIVFVLYWWFKNRLQLQNLLLLVASYVFYGWWDWRFLFLIAFSSAVDFVAGHQLHRSSTDRGRKLWLAASLVVNLGLLAFFKYCNFFIESAVILLHSVGMNASVSTLNIILPVGISFYTFQTLSYTIDIYRRKIAPTTSWLQFFAFVSFFPQLVAGPIERAANLLPQFEKNRSFNTYEAVTGLRLILWGLFKKMVIADRLAVIVDAIYANPESVDSMTALLAACFFSYQLYCDFSGYSDIAIGSARLLGFRLTRNFISPFLSRSMTEFWQRWHVSLSTWFRDYVYIPLGGNRSSVAKWVFNIALTFTISGLWHGASFHFILWGLLCAIPLIIERLLNFKQLGSVFTFLLFSLLMILFRADSVQAAKQFYGAILSLSFNTSGLVASGLPAPQLSVAMMLLALLIIAEACLKRTDFDEALTGTRFWFRWVIYYGLITLILLFGVLDNAPQFVYFQF